jgi:6-phosphogluconolactonase
VGNGGFAFGTGVQNGDVYSVTVATEPSNPTQTCTVYNGSGTIDKAAVTHIIVTCTQAGQFAWVANQTSNDISAYAIDTTTGFLTPLANSPFAADRSTPTAIAVDPNGAYAYVANNGANTVSVYSIDSTSGALTALGSPVATQSGPVDLDGRSLRQLSVRGQPRVRHGLRLLDRVGRLTEISGSPFVVGAGPISVRTDPGGNYLYVVNSNRRHRVGALDRCSTGALTSVAGSPFAAGTGAAIAIDPTGTYAYVANAARRRFRPMRLRPTRARWRR